MPEARTVFVFPNGIVAATDADGRQIPGLQGRFGAVAERIFAAAGPETCFYGWKGIPDGGHLDDALPLSYLDVLLSYGETRRRCHD